MATKPENQFRQSVHRHLPINVHQEKMSNPYSSGTADDWYSGVKADLWVEYKYVPRISRNGLWLCNPNVKNPDISRLQQQWLHARYKENRNVAVIVGCPDGGIILRDLAWEKEISAEVFHNSLLSRSLIAKWIEQQTT